MFKFVKLNKIANEELSTTATLLTKWHPIPATKNKLFCNINKWKLEVSYTLAQHYFLLRNDQLTTTASSIRLGI